MKKLLMSVAFILSAVLPGWASHPDVEMRCLGCHVSIPLDTKRLAFHDDMHLICQGCHEGSHATAFLAHPVNVVPSMRIPEDMHLDAAGRISCITCHAYHNGWQSPATGNPHHLRRPPGKTFCLYCHDRL